VRKLRDLAEELGIFILLLSQLSRAVESRDNKRPQMSDLRESGNIEEFADVIIFLYRESYYKRGFLGAEIGDLIVEINLSKNRQGPNAGRRTLALFRHGLMQWEPCPTDLEESYETYAKQVYPPKKRS
jgi:replicative DNA helicase